MERELPKMRRIAELLCLSGFAFDKGQATGPFECGRDKYGPKLCQGGWQQLCTLCECSGDSQETILCVFTDNMINILSVQLDSLDSGPFNSSFDVGMHNGSVVGAFEWDTYGYFVGCNKLGAQLRGSCSECRHI